ncbi:MAG: endo-1,4-beta-xylanase [Treponema sp.]|jgi:endo-1,4-beta-xylanase|nr:endo-1,4-beta-xylanase [Treponema sp.]
MNLKTVIFRGCSGVLVVFFLTVFVPSRDVACRALYETWGNAHTAPATPASAPTTTTPVAETITPAPASAPTATTPIAETTAPASSALFRADFEAAADGFVGRSGNEVLTVSDEAALSGAHALKVEGRTSSWHGPSLDITQKISEGKEYTVSVWVKLIEPEQAQITLSTQIGSGSGASYNNLNSKQVSQNSDWVELRGTYRYLSTDFVSIYVESAIATASFYIDSLSIIEENSEPAVVEEITPLKNVYTDFFPIGNIASGKDLSGLRLELLTKHFNIVTAENAMKPGELQPRKGEFNFDAADAIVNTMLEYGLAMHGHTLAWHQQTGAWMYTGADGLPLPHEEALENLTTHAKTVAEHFKGRVVSWDVLNEAINDGLTAEVAADWRASLRDSPWLQSIGDHYIEAVFLAAQEADPDAKLYYNDYNLNNQNKATAVYNMVKEINEKYPGLIDGIGMQGHYDLNTNPADVERSIQQFISLGVEVSITELDIGAGADGSLSNDDSLQQALLYARLFSIFRQYKENIGRVTMWGLDDGSSWRADRSPTLFDRSFRAKPAFYATTDPDAFITEHQQ